MGAEEDVDRPQEVVPVCEEKTGPPGWPALVAPAAARHRADGAGAVRALLDTGVRPDAVFCFNDTLALGAVRALHEHGLWVPDDVAVAGFDDISTAVFRCLP